MSQVDKRGLVVLSGNRLETLWSLVAEQLASAPLAPLEREIFLVPSNGIADWLRLQMATADGICAATSIELPGRYLWRAYAQVLGDVGVPEVSPLDKDPLAWRLMRLLTTVCGAASASSATSPDDNGVGVGVDSYAPLHAFLQNGEPRRRLQLASRLADLYDQYQVYRGDWLAAWAAGNDVLIDANDQPGPLNGDQVWQAALWRAILADIGTADPAANPAAAAASGRADVHRRFVDALKHGTVRGLPRRIVLFGASSLPEQTLQALEALSSQCLVIIAVPNPCQYYWGDLIEGRDLLRSRNRGQRKLRNGVDLAEFPLESLYMHGNPLLAAWGRQGRDFLSLLDTFEERHPQLRRAEVFDDSEPAEWPAPLLDQVQAAIRDMEPLPEGEPLDVNHDDRSIVFHIAHSAEREIEILHDQLLALFQRHAAGGESTFAPRDVVVMMPDIEPFAPAIQAIFGQFGHNDPRYIPFQLADQRARAHDPLPRALEWLLSLPTRRCRLSEIRDLLDVPAVARRFGFDEPDLARLSRWMEGAGIRWGLDAEHRDALQLSECGELNTWSFGLNRMLLGYANGADAMFDDIEPYADVAGLDAALVGQLAELIEALRDWRRRLSSDYTPDAWSGHARELLSTFFDERDEPSRFTLASMRTALARWVQLCADAGFEDAVPAELLREAWLDELDAPRDMRGFQYGGVTFCTLMPMRAIPFKVVCLIGMNDGDYPRRASHPDFDLLALAAQRRPGDRARRDDDRYLMLEALLAARHTLYISWTGRSVRDNTEQPPSTLVSQLRDYLEAGWGRASVERLTTEHPLQPFSRRYFEGGALATYAREWRAVYANPPAAAAGPQSLQLSGEALQALTLKMLEAFLRNPVKQFFRDRLNVTFEERLRSAEDDEPFDLDGLQQYALRDTLLDSLRENDALPAGDRDLQLRTAAARLSQTGRLPIGGFGERLQDSLAEELLPLIQHWDAHQKKTRPAQVSKLPLRYANQQSTAQPEAEGEHVALVDWVDGLREEPDGTLQWVRVRPSQLSAKRRGKPPVAMKDKLLFEYLLQVAAAACGLSCTGVVIGLDAALIWPPIDPERARQQLSTLLATYSAGVRSPLPFAFATALAFASAPAPDQLEDAEQKYIGSEQFAGDGKEPCIARAFPDFDALLAHRTPDGLGFEDFALTLFKPMSDELDALTVLRYDQESEANADESAAIAPQATKTNRSSRKKAAENVS
ncbi:exodeoxyribonuclease V subunit gamma [Paraburkholderia sp. FT54]|uniref:exodeoxyribonuclease V subunit gamma n=1 Tax=Paraburkholderia sp. FT54 TaxID=3074437 RepID=UPI0028779A50|nr:exodeoxyribonuclease V subunit gamma [Paraburkholderia sp. FT54]WNC94617.1 exodeoxyribonuclease V subunit gamma [Paraburkholderia sp. FT54]